MPHVSIDALDIHYEDVGEGPVLVWIPGTGLRGSSWRHQLERFRDDYRCLAPDLPGSGDTRSPAVEFTVADLAADLVAWLDALGVETATVAGISLGSAVAQEISLLRPDLVEQLILVSTWSSTAREHHLRRHFESRVYALEHGPLDVFAQFAFWMSSPWLYDHEPELREQVEAELRAHVSANVAGTAAHFRADLGHESRARLAAISCPTLVVHGEDDLITLPWYNRAVADAVPGAVLVAVPRAGHLMWLERPEVLSDIVAGFLDDNGAGWRSAR